MVKSKNILGFIAEGETEKIILEKSDLFQILKNNSIDFISNVIDAGGNGNLLPHNLSAFTNILKSNGATDIIILTDKDKDTCFTMTKDRITKKDPNFEHIIIISAPKIESWFLADSDAMKLYINDSNFNYEFPESVNDPFNEIKNLRMQKVGRGTGTKITLAKSLTNNYNFSIQRAAAHVNCNSAKYFLETILKHS